MVKELILSGVIYCSDLTSQELESRLQNEIFSKMNSFAKNSIEVHFGPRLYERLRVAELLLYNRYPNTIAGIQCRVSYNITDYDYCVFLKHDHEDQIDSMTALFQADVKRQLNAAFGKSSVPIDISGRIKKVIFNPPATIIFWKDGSKTVVKCDGEAFDPEKGMAMAISRKVLGDSYDYYNVFEKWCKKYKEPKSMPTPQEVAAKYMTPPTVSDFNEELQMAAEEVKRYMNIKSGDSDAD